MAGEGNIFGAGGAAYQRGVVKQTADNLRPHYENALRSSRQGVANRGLGGSGVGQYLQNRIGEQYRDQMGQVSNQAAIGGADLNEQNRRMQQARGWSVEDRDLAYAQRAQEIQRQQEYARQQQSNAMWTQLIGGAAGAAGTYFGGPMGGAAAKGGMNSLLGSAANSGMSQWTGKQQGVPYYLGNN